MVNFYFIPIFTFNLVMSSILHYLLLNIKKKGLNFELPRILGMKVKHVWCLIKRWNIIKETCNWKCKWPFVDTRPHEKSSRLVISTSTRSIKKLLFISYLYTSKRKQKGLNRYPKGVPYQFLHKCKVNWINFIILTFTF